MNKTCSKCGGEKDIDSFHRDRTSKDGRQYRCKECANAATREYQKTGVGKISHINSVRKYYKTENGKVAKRRRAKAYNKKYPEKAKAKSAVRRAVRSGKLQKPMYCCVDSSECAGPIEGHHWDYRRPLDVTWLCQKHHNWVHQSGEKTEQLK